MNKGSYKSVRNSGLVIKKKTNKTISRVVEINDTSLDQAISDLESGNIVAVKNFLKSLKGKQYKASRKTREILEEYSEELKKNTTPSEKILRKLLKELNIKFVFQKHITYKKGVSYIMDFYLPMTKTCIEVDGGYHNTKLQEDKDLIRTSNLNKMKVEVIRFTNDEVINKELVISKLKDVGILL